MLRPIGRVRARLPPFSQWAQSELQEKQSLFGGRGTRRPDTPPDQSWRDDRFPPANEGCREVRHVPPAPDARERRNRWDGAVIWLLVSSCRWLWSRHVPEERAGARRCPPYPVLAAASSCGFKSRRAGSLRAARGGKVQASSGLQLTFPRAGNLQ